MYRFITLSNEHNTELLQFFQSANSGSEHFSVSRGNDFFSLAREAGRTTYYGITRQDKLVACLGITIQKRFIEGAEEDVYYIRDLRMNAGSGNPVAYRKLITGLFATYPVEPGHVFSVILGENPNKHAITEGKELFRGVNLIGEIRHVGFPLFYGSQKDSGVDYIDAEEAWIFYREHAQNINYALADKEYFVSENGFFLGIKENGVLQAVCKMVNQDKLREIIALRKSSVAQQLINIYCHIKGVKGLPGKNEIFSHLYLSFYTASAQKDYRDQFVAFVRKHYSSQYCYLFTGMLPQEAAAYHGRFLQHFSSFVYGYMNRSGSTFQFPELTLI